MHCPTCTLLTSLTLLFTTLATPTPSQLFALKTVSTDTRFDSLCVTPHHIGAGMNDALLTSCHAGDPSDRFLLIFYSNGSLIGSTAFGRDVEANFIAGQGASYDSWYQTYINTGNPSPTVFTYDDHAGYLAEGKYGFLACSWAHKGAAELFVLSRPGYDVSELIDTCGFVGLFPTEL